MYLLGCDIGSSSVKVSLVESQTGKIAGSASYPHQEAFIEVKHAGWAEQSPLLWWDYLKMALAELRTIFPFSADDLCAIGITYQMHGLVLVDKNLELLRPAIIWCDSRAVPYGEAAFEAIGKDYCLAHLLNSPANFTASKLAWVKENEPAIFEKIYKFMLPGDYIALRLTGEVTTTVQGLSEAMMWNFKDHCLDDAVMNYYGFSKDLVPNLVPAFGLQGQLSVAAAVELHLSYGTPITYRSGDQPNNAMSLGVLNPGEVAATAGTSGVVYGINNAFRYDSLARINFFAHVNHTFDHPRIGVMHCTNGAGILNSWVKHNIGRDAYSYDELNQLAIASPIGAKGLTILPFGNGAERILQNREINCSIKGLNFNIHQQGEFVRAAQEGIAFSFHYGMDIMKVIGVQLKVIRAGNDNLFLSPLFREALATITGATIELFDTNGASGAARGAGIGANIYNSFQEAFSNLKQISTIEPSSHLYNQYCESYNRWYQFLSTMLPIC